mmetsp:Transcript_43640/g.115234  ORF Transcript_43640/g.115234 Transcript_43640/m.115234 type:complete len:294 (-) Transcript_43640:284-1165(-)
MHRASAVLGRSGISGVDACPCAPGPPRAPALTLGLPLAPPSPALATCLAADGVTKRSCELTTTACCRDAEEGACNGVTGAVTPLRSASGICNPGSTDDRRVAPACWTISCRPAPNFCSTLRDRGAVTECGEPWAISEPSCVPCRRNCLENSGGDPATLDPTRFADGVTKRPAKPAPVLVFDRHPVTAGSAGRDPYAARMCVSQLAIVLVELKCEATGAGVAWFFSNAPIPSYSALVTHTLISLSTPANIPFNSSLNSVSTSLRALAASDSSSIGDPSRSGGPGILWSNSELAP